MFPGVAQQVQDQVADEEGAGFRRGRIEKAGKHL
jgi:hypothetical protein